MVDLRVYLHSPISQWHGACLIKHRENFTLSLYLLPQHPRVTDEYEGSICIQNASTTYDTGVTTQATMKDNI
jgi:hypothetical protein